MARKIKETPVPEPVPEKAAKDNEYPGKENGINEMCDTLGIDGASARRWLRKNEYETLGGRYRWSDKEFDAILKAYQSTEKKTRGRPKANGEDPIPVVEVQKKGPGRPKKAVEPEPPVQEAPKTRKVIRKAS